MALEGAVTISSSLGAYRIRGNILVGIYVKPTRNGILLDMIYRELEKKKTTAGRKSEKGR